MGQGFYIKLYNNSDKAYTFWVGNNQCMKEDGLNNKKTVPPGSWQDFGYFEASDNILNGCIGRDSKFTIRATPVGSSTTEEFADFQIRKESPPSFVTKTSDGKEVYLNFATNSDGYVSLRKLSGYYNEHFYMPYGIIITKKAVRTILKPWIVYDSDEKAKEVFNNRLLFFSNSIGAVSTSTTKFLSAAGFVARLIPYVKYLSTFITQLNEGDFNVSYLTYEKETDNPTLYVLYDDRRADDVKIINGMIDIPVPGNTDDDFFEHLITMKNLSSKNGASNG